MKKLLFLASTLFTIFICQAQQPFITTWEVTQDDLEITIPTFPANIVDYGYNYSVDFGDGTVLNNQAGNTTHIYNSPGIYQVIISGDFPYFYSSGDSNLLNKNQIISIDQWGDIPWMNMRQAFKNCINLQINATDVPNLSNVTDMSEMFYGCDSLNTNINDWDVSNVTNMSEMFHSAISFNQSLNNWDVSNVTDMSEMFRSAISFNQPLNNWDVSSVQTMRNMFEFTPFNQNIDAWNVSNVSDMSRMFKHSKFNQPLNNWDVSSVTYMRFLFHDNEDFNQPLGNWDVSNVTDMTRMFYYAKAFNQNLNDWDVSSVSSMDGTFSHATNFNYSLDNWDVSNVIDFQHMFHAASSFNQSLENWNINTSELNGFVASSGLDTSNYNLLLDRLVQLDFDDGWLGAWGLKHCNEFSRQILEDRNWFILDAEVSSNCNIKYVKGCVKFDSNSDGCNNDDYNIFSSMVKITNNNNNQNLYININQYGEYLAALNPGNYSISLTNLNSILTSTPPTQSINLSGQDEIIEDIDFCITANQQFEDLSIDIFPLEDAIPGFETDYQVIVSNSGTQIVPNVQVTFGYDGSFQTYVSSTVPISSSSMDLLTFQFTNLDPFSQEVFEITMINVIPPTLNSGDVLTLTAQITPDANDSNIKDNSAIYEQTVVNSFDPNDKMVIQGDEIDINDTDQYLDYRIRFQNLGTANALNVKITDTIHANLDWTTFQPITSSHDYRIEIVDGEQINFYFDNINLPYEDEDAEGSNGYITYKIKPKPSVQIGDTFENTAYIYFDFNLPIITNTVMTTVVEELGTNAFDAGQIRIYPNPVSDNLNIDLPSGLKLNSVELFDIQGKLIKVFNDQKELDLSEVQKGVYILRLDTNQGVYNHKIIKE
jgi:uncharacterized repeat protein (TIGR01451 family)